jgi:hypothetical protein
MQDKARQGIRKEEEIRGNNPDMEISFFSFLSLLVELPVGLSAEKSR